MTQVRDLMTPMPQTIGFDISVEKALEMMQEYACHHLPVLNGGKLVGVLSDRDLSMARHDSSNAKTEHLVGDLMSDEPIVIEPSAEINTAIRIMLNNKINSLIVKAEANQPWGILTSTDLLRYVVEKT
ncbi:CBS domain-containing protein [Nitrosomonas sp. HPC101]|uniref:CBS domain-containing protein n=1 Tax=Nitrosomonas sp. HPC101 TaxID=1658667 RepID=UPI00136DE19A|nr:CBS domain-containing protein [Nitrosomonas sp. HPC101]MXS84563.1 CBS domain-containing protein [Nitrosomonas sp. HPC101]